jgi:enterobactin synthetase component D
MTLFDIAFAIDLPHGACVAVHLPARDALVAADDVATLATEERAFADALAPNRRAAWIGGRVALRAAAARAGVSSLGAILATPRGAPLVPPELAASISHKETIAVALAARADGASLGVDVELDAPRRIDVSSRILRDEELAEIDALAADDRARAVLLRFSAKESIYQALDPFVGRYVAFKEARVTPRDDGTTLAELHLANADGEFDVDVRWLRRDGLVLTTARVRRS